MANRCMWPRAVNQMEYVLRYVMESSDAQLFRMMIARYSAIGEVHGRAASSSFRYTADLVHSAAHGPPWIRCQQ